MPGAVPDLQSIEIAIQIESPDPKDKVNRLYEASLERCPVYLALTKATSVKATLT